MLDNRLDNIVNLKPETSEKISFLRDLYIALDDELIKLGDDQAGHRHLHIARNSLESSLFYCIKTIEIQGEEKGKGVAT